MADEEELISANNDEVFVYMGGDMVVPMDVVRAQVHPSVTVIPARAFFCHNKLEEIELCEGLTEIGNNAFQQSIYQCSSLKHVNIPSTVKTIGGFAFCFAPLQTLHLPDSVESIRVCAFAHGQFPNVRIPPLVNTIEARVFYNCSSMFSAELPETITQVIGKQNIGGVFDNCRSLRNVALPPHAVVGVNAFEDCIDLLQLFGSDTQIGNGLKHRFDNLPIHKVG